MQLYICERQLFALSNVLESACNGLHPSVDMLVLPHGAYLIGDVSICPCIFFHSHEWHSVLSTFILYSSSHPPPSPPYRASYNGKWTQTSDCGVCSRGGVCVFGGGFTLPGHAGVTHLSSETTFLLPAVASKYCSMESTRGLCVYWEGGAFPSLPFPRQRWEKHQHMLYATLSNLWGCATSSPSPNNDAKLL